MDLNSAIRSEFLQLSEIFDDGRIGKLVVPDYQRGFDWNQSHVDDLWEDLKYYLNKDLNNEREDFFVGTVILKTPDENTIDGRYEIVDGQQRLTSFYLLCIALRQKFKEFNNTDKVRDIDRDFLNSYDDDDERSPKLLGTKKIREFLRFISNKDWDNKFPTKDDFPDIHGSTINAVNRILRIGIKSHQDELDGNGSITKALDEKTLIGLYRVIKRIKIIVLSVNTYERAFYLFETTNARGKALEPGDLLKNHLFRTISESKRDEIYDRWEDVVERSAGKLIIMLKHFYYVQDRHVQKKDLYKKLKQLCESEPLLLKIEDYSIFHNLMHKGSRNDFEEYFYEKLKIFDSKQEVKKINEILISIKALRFFKSELTYPVIYAFLKKFSEFLNEDPILKDSKKRSSFKKQLQTLFGGLENFQFINYKICSNKGNLIEIPYATFAGMIYKSKTISEFLKNLEDLYKFLRSGINSYNIFEDEFNQISYENKDRHLIHYIFHKIEENRIDGQLKDPIFNPNAKSKLYDIEHWSPQDLTTHSNTQEDYAEYLDIYESIVENNLIHNIGNLASIHNSLNQELSNKIPKVKQKFLEDNSKSQKFIISSYFKDFYKKDSLWDAKDIENRSKSLAKECYEKVFSIGDSFNYPKISKQYLEKFDS